MNGDPICLREKVRGKVVKGRKSHEKRQWDETNVTDGVRRFFVLKGGVSLSLCGASSLRGLQG